MGNIFSVKSKIQKGDRQSLNNHKSFCLWFTGLPSSGKSCISLKLEEILFQQKIRTYILDGDNLRNGLNKDLDFSHHGRTENIRRISEVAKLLVEAGIIVITAFISPYRADRENARKLFENEGEFLEVYIKASLETCEARDPKGLYKKARAGAIKDFTGIDSPYEEPVNPELIINTDEENNIEANALKILDFLVSRNYLFFE